MQPTELNLRLQTRTLGMHSRHSQSHAQRLWQSADIPHRPACMHWLPLCSRRVSPSVVTNALVVYSRRTLLGISRMKAILFSFVRSFNFELAVPPTEITRKTMIVGRPFLTSN